MKKLLRLPSLPRLRFPRFGKKRSASPVVATPERKPKKTVITFSLDKRQKFVVAVILLSLGLFFSGAAIGRAALIISVFLAMITDFFLFWSIRADLKENAAWSVFVLPFFYSLAFCLFYFLIPARLLFRVPLTVIYAFGLYSLFLSQNVFIVASIRTIALLSGARIVSFVITIISYFFITNIIYSLHVFVPISLLLLAVATYPLVYQSLWTYNLQKSVHSLSIWSAGITLCLVELALALWFWPSTPTVVALFLAGFMYAAVGLSHTWFEKRLFKNVLWEYVWVAMIVFLILNLFTTWGN